MSMLIKEPKRGDVVHLCQLITGDRFYCKSDVDKKVWELRFHSMVKTKQGMKKLSQCKDLKNGVERFDANRVVVFLRRTKPIINRVREFSIDQYFA